MRAGEDRLAPIPSSILLPDPISYPAYRIRRVVPIGGAILAVLLWVAASHVLTRRGPPAWLSRPIAPLLDRPGVALTILIVVAVAMRIFMMLGSNAILWGDSEVFIESFRLHSQRAVLGARSIPHACSTRISWPPS